MKTAGQLRISHEAKMALVDAPKKKASGVRFCVFLLGEVGKNHGCEDFFWFKDEGC